MLLRRLFAAGWVLLAGAAVAPAAEEAAWPPQLPGGKSVASGTSDSLIKPPAALKDGVAVARTAPQVDFLYFQGQTYLGNPWSVWGDGLAVGEKYYTAIGDHKSPQGNAQVYVYDSKTKELKLLLETAKLLNLPEGHYMPGKIHTRLDLGSDGWLYFATHRGSTRTTTPQYHFKGDWILRLHPESGKTEIVAHAPLPMQCMPAGQLDPERLIFYSGTADGLNKEPPKFLAYDVKNRKVLYSDDAGFHRAMILSRSTGKVYYHNGKSTPGKTGGPASLVRFDPDKPGPPVPIKAAVGLRAATLETPQGLVYTIDGDHLWAFDVKTEKATDLGPAAVGQSTYTTSIDADPSGRYLYYVPGAHGGAERDGTPLVQYDTQTRTRKVICFLHPYLWDQYRYVAIGTFATDVSPDGDKVYITFNGDRPGGDEPPPRGKFHTCALAVVHIPESERRP